MNTLNVKDMSFSYSKNEYLLNRLNFNLEPGAVYGLLGKNGSGKSTLLYLLTGLMFPQKGDIEYGEHSVAKRLPYQLGKLYLLPEEFDLPAITAGEYVSNYAAFYSTFNYEQFEQYMQIFELSKDSNLRQLSMGQKKKFLVSFALATEVEYIFMDEPTNGMDIPSKSQFRKAIAKGMNDDRSIIISTHQVRDLESMIDHVLILHDHNMVVDERITHIAEKLEFVYTTVKEELEGCFYSTFTPSGFVGVRPNQAGVETQVDLEVLFNSIITCQQAVTRLFV